jgi:hypothetical protein
VPHASGGACSAGGRSSIRIIKGEKMNDLSRRRFLKHGSLGVAFAGVIALVPGLSAVLKLPAPAVATGSEAAQGGPLIAHVRDLTNGEIVLLVGTEQVIQRDRDLAARLYAAARRR